MMFALNGSIFNQRHPWWHHVVYQLLFGMNCVFVSNQLYNEYVQFKSEGNFVKYLTNYWNLNDLVYLFLNPLLLISNLFELMPLESLRLIAAISSIFLFVKVIDWLRLFDATAFYVSLMLQTVYSIRWFMIIMIIWWMTFGTAFYILNMTRLDKDPESAIVPDVYGVWFLDALQNQYELGLGEFQLEQFGEGGDVIFIYFLFAMATFLI